MMAAWHAALMMTAPLSGGSREAAYGDCPCKSQVAYLGLGQHCMRGGEAAVWL